MRLNWSAPGSEVVEIRLKFDSYASEYGNLFEDSYQPMTPEDTADIERRRKRFSKIFLIIYACGMACVTAMLIFGKPPQGSDYYSIAALIGFPLIFRAVIMFGFNQALKNKKKRIIHGVITNMYRKGRNLSIEFSRKLTIRILPADYKTLKLGDIVRVEILADDLYIKRKYVVEGKI